MKAVNRIKLGFFVLMGVTFLILGLYFIGSKRNIFHSSIKVSAVFNDVNGLISGNNVRFNGINVGIVSKLTVVSDTSVKVDFTIDKKVTKYIYKSAIASIGSDGLLGNKLINITCKNDGEQIEEGDVLQIRNSVDMDNELRTLSTTNSNLKDISENLKSVTDKLNKSNSLWNLLADSSLAQNIKTSIVNIRMVTNQTAIITGNLRDITQGIKDGKGTLGALITDTVISSKINQVVVKLERISDTAALITGDILQIVGNVKNGKGSVGMLINDTSFVHNLNQTVNSINKTSVTANEDLEAIKHSFLFRRYFEELEYNKQKAKEKKDPKK